MTSPIGGNYNPDPTQGASNSQNLTPAQINDQLNILFSKVWDNPTLQEGFKLAQELGSAIKNKKGEKEAYTNMQNWLKNNKMDVSFYNLTQGNGKSTGINNFYPGPNAPQLVQDTYKITNEMEGFVSQFPTVNEKLKAGNQMDSILTAVNSLFYAATQISEKSFSDFETSSSLQDLFAKTPIGPKQGETFPDFSSLPQVANWGPNLDTL